MADYVSQFTGAEIDAAVANKVEANPTLYGGEEDLSSIKIGNTNYRIAGSLPSGGYSGQVLVKQSSFEGDVAWETLDTDTHTLIRITGQSATALDGAITQLEAASSQAAGTPMTVYTVMDPQEIAGMFNKILLGLEQLKHPIFVIHTSGRTFLPSNLAADVTTVPTPIQYISSTFSEPVVSSGSVTLYKFEWSIHTNGTTILQCTAYPATQLS